MDRSRTRGATVLFSLSFSFSPLQRPGETKKEPVPDDEEETKTEGGGGERRGAGKRSPPKSPSASSKQPPRVRDAESYTLGTRIADTWRVTPNIIRAA